MSRIISEKLPIPYQIIPTGYGRLLELDNNGTLYIQDSNVLRKSEDWGETITEVQSFDNLVNRCTVLDNGNILIFTTNSTPSPSETDVYLSEDGGNTFNHVYNSVSTIPHWGGLDSFNNMIVYSDYTGDVDDQYSIHISKDGGESFEIMKTFYNIHHFHDVRIDPYEGNFIWAVTGDSSHSNRIFVTDDFGETWTISPNFEEYRLTNIMPLPNHILFGSDMDGTMGSFCIKRPKHGTFQSEISPEYFWKCRKDTGTTTALYWATAPAITYGDNGLCFWGYYQPSGSQRFPATVYCSDGEKVRTIWTQEKISDVTTGRGGIVGVYGPDKYNNLAVDLRSEYTINGTTTEQHILKIELGMETPKDYRGLSTDTKPTVNVPLYSKFLELDTVNVYYWDGTEWKEVE